MILMDTYSILTITSLPSEYLPLKNISQKEKRESFLLSAFFEVKGRHLTEPELIQISRYRDEVDPITAVAGRRVRLQNALPFLYDSSKICSDI